MKKCIAGMSGGVDSSVTMLLLQEQGYDVVGVTLLLHGEKNDSDIADAKAVCDRMGIPHMVVDGHLTFRHCVMEHFAEVYQAGETPNPCVDCNRRVKFPLLMEAMENQQGDFIATGHYAQVQKENGRYLLKKAVDPAKDQSYVLYSLTQNQLAHLILPLGTLSKPQVRELAREHGFATASKSDSQDICFIPDGDYGQFLERFTGKHFPGGNFIDEAGRVLGQHNGAVRYTLGQRRGLGIPAEHRLYVIGKNMEHNTVTLGTNDALFAKTLYAANVNLISCDRLGAGEKMWARVRYQQREQPCMVWQTGDDTIRVEFETAQRAIAPGQAVVLYDGDTVVGGGTITGAE